MKKFIVLVLHQKIHCKTQIKYYKKIQAQKAINLIKKYNNFMYQQIPQI